MSPALLTFACKLLFWLANCCEGPPLPDRRPADSLWISGFAGGKQRDGPRCAAVQGFAFRMGRSTATVGPLMSYPRVLSRGCSVPPPRGTGRHWGRWRSDQRGNGCDRPPDLAPLVARCSPPHVNRPASKPMWSRSRSPRPRASPHQDPYRPAPEIAACLIGRFAGLLQGDRAWSALTT